MQSKEQMVVVSDNVSVVVTLFCACFAIHNTDIYRKVVVVMVLVMVVVAVIAMGWCWLWSWWMWQSWLRRSFLSWLWCCLWFCTEDQVHD